MDAHEKLLKIVKDKIDRMSYEDKREKTRSGMTKLQEYLRQHGIKEHRNSEPYDHEKYMATNHPAAWACDGFYQTTYSLLFPNELALKILTLGTMP